VPLLAWELLGATLSLAESIPATDAFSWLKVRVGPEAVRQFRCCFCSRRSLALSPTIKATSEEAEGPRDALRVARRCDGARTPCKNFTGLTPRHM